MDNIIDILLMLVMTSLLTRLLDVPKIGYVGVLIFLCQQVTCINDLQKISSLITLTDVNMTPGRTLLQQVMGFLN